MKLAVKPLHSRLVSVFLLSVAALGPLSVESSVSAERVASQEDPAAKLADARKLLIMMGTDKMALQMMSQLLEQYRTMLPQVPEAFWTEFMKEVKPEELIDLSAKVYVKHLSQADIQELIRFYESPTGQRFITAQPQILQESMKAGQEWGAALGQRVTDRLQKEGYRL